MSQENRVSLEFRNLPLMDVTLRMILGGPIQDFGFDFLVKLHDQIKVDFPHAEVLPKFEQQPGLESTLQPGQIMSMMFFPPIPGVTLRIQNNMLFSSWSRSVEPDGTEYPRYSFLKESLRKFLDAVIAASSTEVPSAFITNVNYLNFIDKVRNEDSIATFFRREVIGELFENALETHFWSSNYKTNHGRDRFVDFRPAQMDKGEEPLGEGFLLKTSGGSFVETNNVWNVLDGVHEDMQNFFLTLLSDEAKQRWGYVRND